MAGDGSLAGGPLIGVLAIQGGFEAHGRILERLGVAVRAVRVPTDLEGLAGLVIPGGESTTMTLGVRREGLAEPLRELVLAGLPVLGSCAGLIMLDRNHLELLDMVARRNAFGRQIRSFEADLEVRGIHGGPIRGIFIRAPWIAEHGPSVEILAELDGHPVAARQGSILAVAFHSELGSDDRLHRLFVEMVRENGARAPARARARVLGSENHNPSAPDSEELRLDSQGLPPDSEELRLDTEGLPLDSEGLRLDSEGLPLDSEGLPLDSEGLPLPEGRP